MIPYGRQEVTAEDIAAVVEVLKSDWLTQGPVVPRFENAVAAYCGAKHAVALNSATSALHVACLALGLGPGDALWTVANTFVASANCGRYCGAEVDFVDIDPQTLNLSVTALTAKLAAHRSEGRRLPKVVVPVHFAGRCCDMAALRTLADEYGFQIVEDASHAIGGRYRGAPVGDGRYADAVVFSFHPVKIITTGEGGMILCHDAALAESCRGLRSHGIVRESRTLEQEGAWYYEQVDLGFNYRMTDIQAALGVAQLKRLDAYVATRTRLADRYDRILDGLPVGLPSRDPYAVSAWHLYVVHVDPAIRRRVFDRLRAAGIGVNVHYRPVYLQADYRKLGFAPGYCPEAERHYAGALTLPLYPGLSDAQQDFVVAMLKQALMEEAA
jgi:UDP-4-amino-4,6-dideoxy-N-acetyl-beta-L-altrosamine transaminase